VSLMDCPECGKEISDRASTCPSCAFPMANYEAGSFGDLDSGGRVGERIRSETFRKKDILTGLICLLLAPFTLGVSIIWWLIHQWRGTERRL
jgi:zinc-ribbon domain